MVTFHYIEFKTHCHATENIEKVKDAVENIVDQELEFEISEAEGFYGNPIKILEAKISRNREMDHFFNNISDSIIEVLQSELERRIDERCNFFFRIDKGNALEEEYFLTSGGNSVRVRARVESYPSKKETAVKKMEEYLSDILED